jgi:hypothetical protein
MKSEVELLSKPRRNGVSGRRELPLRRTVDRLLASLASWFPLRLMRWSFTHPADAVGSPPAKLAGGVGNHFKLA